MTDERRGHTAVEKLQRQVTGIDLSLAQLHGQIDTIDARIEANAEQREGMALSLRQIESHLRELNGRTRKNEDNIAGLQYGQSSLIQELTRTLAMQPDGTVSMTALNRPPLSAKQKVGAAAVGVPLVLGGIDLIRQGIELAIEWLKHSGPK